MLPDLLAAIALPIALYLLLAYLILPALWSDYERQPALRELRLRTVTGEGIPGDALNVGLVGEAAELLPALHAAGWSPADPITLKTSLAIAGSVLFHRPDPYAPVSNLFFHGRRQDLAFEKPAGVSASRRHHVRFWQALERGREGRPVWLGAATFDRGVGVSRYTGEVTHHIAADIDAERDRLIADLGRAGALSHVYRVSGIGPTLLARNGGGDPFHTDGDIVVGVVHPGAALSLAEPEVLPSPAAIAAKNAVWARAKALLSRGREGASG